MSNQREQWGSRLGFILAASGSAVGLGNIWKYPHMAGQNGGAAFTIVYLVCILIVGLPILLGELVIGRNTQLSPVGAYDRLAKKSNWKWVGLLGVASAFVILSFYGGVGGWTLRYTFYSLFGGFESLSGNADVSGEVFNSFVSNSINPIFWQLLFMSICIGIILKGVKSGIEEWSKIMMPVIIVLLGVLAIRGMTLEGGMEGLSFLFNPRFEDLTALTANSFLYLSYSKLETINETQTNPFLHHSFDSDRRSCLGRYRKNRLQRTPDRLCRGRWGIRPERSKTGREASQRRRRHQWQADRTSGL